MTALAIADAREHRLALAAAAFTGVQVGAAMVASRWIIDSIGPATLAMGRYAIATLVLLPWVLAMPRVRFAWRDWLAITGLGIVQFGVLIVLLNMGLRHLDAARAAMLFATFPLMTGIVAFVLGRELMTTAKWLGTLVATLGVIVVLSGKVDSDPSGNALRGAMAVLGSAACGAVCSVLYRPYLQRYPTVPVGALAMAAATVFLILLAWPEWQSRGTPALTPGGWGAVVFIGLSSGIGYTAWLWALRQAPPTLVTNFLSLGPVTASALGVIFLGEPVTGSMGFGLIAVVGGLWIATRLPRPFF